jgi:hypothetical protein
MNDELLEENRVQKHPVLYKIQVVEARHQPLAQLGTWPSAQLRSRAYSASILNRKFPVPRTRVRQLPGPNTEDLGESTPDGFLQTAFLNTPPTLTRFS